MCLCSSSLVPIKQHSFENHLRQQRWRRPHSKVGFSLFGDLQQEFLTQLLKMKKRIVGGTYHWRECLVHPIFFNTQTVSYTRNGSLIIKYYFFIFYNINHRTNPREKKNNIKKQKSKQNTQTINNTTITKHQISKYNDWKKKNES